MRLFTLLGSLAVISCAHAVLKFTNSWSGVTSGVPFLLTWSGDNGAVTIKLENGTTASANDVNTIVCEQESKWLHESRS